MEGASEQPNIWAKQSVCAPIHDEHYLASFILDGEDIEVVFELRLLGEVIYILACEHRKYGTKSKQKALDDKKVAFTWCCKMMICLTSIQHNNKKVFRSRLCRSAWHGSISQAKGWVLKGYKRDKSIYFTK